MTVTRGAAAELDLARVIPLTGHRTLSRVLVAIPIVSLAAGIAGVAVAGRDSPWTILLSLPIPGVGALVQGRWLAGIALVLIAAFSYLRWQFRSDAWFPPLVLGIAIWDAATRGAWWAWPAGIATGLAGIVVGRAIATSRREARLRKFRQARASAPRDGREFVPAVPEPPRSTECTPVQESFLRYFQDFGHRPLDDWSGFSEAKEGTDSALRYQTVLAAWSIYVAQQRLTPAYREAAAAALGNLAQRGREYRLWNYWPSQNLRGSFRIGADPFAIENVMYAGYVADVAGMYEAMSGDVRFDEPGGYSVTDGSRTFEWSHDQIVDRLAEQHATSPLGGIPCQPGWVFPACQTFSMRAILLGDQVHGTDHGWAIERFGEAFRRYFYSNGSMDLCRHNVMGIASPFNYLMALNGQAGTGAFFSPFAPELAAEHYQRVIREHFVEEPDGAISLRLSRLDEFDTSYGTNAGLAYAMVLLYAREVGADEDADRVQVTLERMLTPDAPRPAPGSVVSNAITFLAFVDAAGGLAAAHRRVPSRQGGLELAHAPWPKVLVTGARSDGESLTCSLAPGPEANGRVALAFSGLAPGRPYALEGVPQRNDVVADERGGATVEVESGQRSRIVLRRAG